MLDLLKTVLPAVVTAILAWFASAWTHKRDGEATKIAQEDRLEIHRDELTFELLENARAEMTILRTELEAMRKETNTLRKLERHIYHFQQSLDHLEAVLAATTDEERQVAERNARAFLNRMRRLADAEGNIANEVQRVQSEVSIRDQGIHIFRGTDDVDKI